MAPEATEVTPLYFSPSPLFRCTHSCNYLSDLEERMSRYIPFELHGELSKWADTVTHCDALLCEIEFVKNNLVVSLSTGH